ncbi:MAG: enoyl-CoA hydratase/isomerase family protein [Phycisphaerales bacterium]|nr:enoyl-CoA hydratase/isomerase family protein [Phycisphaerales bacterium]
MQSTPDQPLALVVESSGPFAGIATLTLEQPGSPMVVLDRVLIQRIEAALRGLPNALTGLVLASASPRVFIAGADLKTIQADPANPDADRVLDAYLAYGQRVFGMICELPYPTAAAIGGAALGGGLEIAMHCDALIGAPNASGKPYPVGLPEAGLSICPGWGGTNLLPARIDPSEAIRRTASGKPMTFDEAISAKLFDAVAPSADALLSTAKQWIVDHRTKLGRRDGAPSRWIGRPETKPQTLAAIAKLAPATDEALKTDPAQAVLAAVNAGLNSGWQAALAIERRELVRLRNTPAGRAAIQAFFDKSKK